MLRKVDDVISHGGFSEMTNFPTPGHKAPLGVPSLQESCSRLWDGDGSLLYPKIAAGWIILQLVVGSFEIEDPFTPVQRFTMVPHDEKDPKEASGPLGGGK